MLIHCILLCGYILICVGLKHTIHYELDLNFRDKHCSTGIVFTGSAVRATECMTICAGFQGCYSAIFQSSSNTCYGYNLHVPCASYTAATGAKFYRKKCGSIVALVTGPHGVADSQITATSSYNGNYLPAAVRLNGPTAWAALTDNDVNQYVQINFGRLKFITGIITQGSSFPNPDEWVTTYRVLYSSDCVTFTTVTTTTGSQDFTGNVNADGEVSHTFQPSFVAQCIRVNPRSWQVWATIRVEIMGCVNEPTQ